MKLSIIIPAYNVEKYIECCIRSCVDQAPISLGDDYEIIVVNDGAKDATPEILESLKFEIPELKIVHQENQGLSGARNAGLNIAQGDFVWFVDGDDTIEKNCLKDLEGALKKEFDAVQIYANTINGEILEPRAVFNYTGAKSGDQLLIENNVCCCAPFTIYNRDFLNKNDLRFCYGIFHEDNEFTPRAYHYAKHVVSYPHFLYFVTMNPMSITHVPNPKRSFDCLKIADNLLKFKREQGIDKNKKMNACFSDHIGQVCSNAFSMILQNKNKSEYNRFYVQLSQHRAAFKDMWYSNKIKYKLYSILMLMISFVPKFSALIFRLV